MGTEEKKNSKLGKVITYVVGVLVILGAGFFAGRKTMKVEPETNTVYVPGDTVKILVDNPVPVYVKKPIDTANIIADCIKSGKFTDLFPVRDSIIVVTKEDTAAVIMDWASERTYEEKVFDIDTVGTATMTATVQYNRLTQYSTTFVPINKQTTITNTVVKKFSPFVGAGITTMPEIVVNGGIFLEDKYGASLMYEYDWERKKSAAGLTVMMKF